MSDQALLMLTEHRAARTRNCGLTLGKARAHLQVALLGATVFLGRLVEQRQIVWMTEAGVALILGMVVSGIVALLDGKVDVHFSDMFRFNTQYFFLLLLPPIIFNAGFNLEVAPLFRNLGSITLLAFAGTVISVGVVAVVMWSAGAIGASLSISVFHAAIFGAIISADDTVSVMAVFGRLHTDTNLTALIFGESIFNDAVAIVLFNVILSSFGPGQSDIQRVSDIFAAVGDFAVSFAGAVAVGVGFALAAARLFQTGWLHSPHAPVESSVSIVFAYCAFYLANGLGISGITAMCFCGITMAKYCRPFLREANDFVGALFRCLGYLAEIFTFLFIGLSLFTDGWLYQLPRAWPFVLCTVVAMGVARAAQVYPMTALANFCTPPDRRRIPTKHKHMLWYAGLRGAMAFALAAMARDALAGTPQGDLIGAAMIAATFVMILATVLFNGGTIYFLLHRWGLTQGGAHAGNPDMILTPPSSDNESDDDEDLEGQPDEGGLASLGVVQSIRQFQREGGIMHTMEAVDHHITEKLLGGEVGPQLPTRTVREQEHPATSAAARFQNGQLPSNGNDAQGNDTNGQNGDANGQNGQAEEGGDESGTRPRRHHDD